VSGPRRRRRRTRRDRAGRGAAPGRRAGPRAVSCARRGMECVCRCALCRRCSRACPPRIAGGWRSIAVLCQPQRCLAQIPTAFLYAPVQDALDGTKRCGMLARLSLRSELVPCFRRCRKPTAPRPLSLRLYRFARPDTSKLAMSIPWAGRLCVLASRSV
jgi:hypothetical protein